MLLGWMQGCLAHEKDERNAERRGRIRAEVRQLVNRLSLWDSDDDHNGVFVDEYSRAEIEGS